MSLDRDINYQLRKAYVSALKNNIEVEGKAVPIFYGYVSATEDLSHYIIIENINSNDRSTKCSRDTDTDIQLTIYSRKLNNSGKEVDEIAAKIFELIGAGCEFENENFQVRNARCVVDKTVFSMDTMNKDKSMMRVFERHLIFNHKVYHKWV